MKRNANVFIWSSHSVDASAVFAGRLSDPSFSQDWTNTALISTATTGRRAGIIG